LWVRRHAVGSEPMSVGAPATAEGEVDVFDAEGAYLGTVADGPGLPVLFLPDGRAAFIAYEGGRARLRVMRIARGAGRAGGLRRDLLLEPRRIRDPGVQRADAPHRAVEPGKELVGDAGGDLRADPPRERVLVHDEDLARLLHRGRDALHVEGLERAQIDHLG